MHKKTPPSCGGVGCLRRRLSSNPIHYCCALDRSVSKNRLSFTIPQRGLSSQNVPVRRSVPRLHPSGTDAFPVWHGFCEGFPGGRNVIPKFFHNVAMEPPRRDSAKRNPDAPRNHRFRGASFALSAKDAAYVGIHRRKPGISPAGKPARHAFCSRHGDCKPMKL